MMDGPRPSPVHFSPYQFQRKQPRSSVPSDSVVAGDAASTTVFHAAPLFTQTSEGGKILNTVVVYLEGLVSAPAPRKHGSSDSERRRKPQDFHVPHSRTNSQEPGS